MAALRARPIMLVLALLIAAVIADWALTGVWTIQQDEQGVVLRFGAVARRLSPGIQFTLPFPFETVDVVNIHETRKMPVGFRIVPGRDPAAGGVYESQWLSGDWNVIDVNMMIHYVIRDPVQYLYRMGSGDADFLIRKCAESILTETIAGMQVDDVFTTGKVRIQEATRRGSQDLLDRVGAGIAILSANIQEIAPPAEVKEAFNEVSSAKADKERLIQEADGYIKDRLPMARAEAFKLVRESEIYEDTTVSEARGRAERFKALLAEYALAKDVTRKRLYLDAVQRLLERPVKIIVNPDGEGRARVRIVR